MTAIIKNFFKGIAFGISGTIPAVSGGTIAVILGFYNELIEAMNHFTQNWHKYIKFLLPLLLGIISGLVFFSSIMNYFLLNFSFPTMLFFIGLIAGSVPVIYLKIHKNEVNGEKRHGFSVKEVICILTPILALFIVPYLKLASDADPAELIKQINIPFMIFIGFVGIVSGSFLIIPGVSGVLFQLLMGIYPLVIHSIASVRFLLIDITNVALLFDILKVLVPMAIGILISCFLMARLIEKLLQNHNRATYCVILGLLLGSIYVLFREPLVYQSGVSPLIITEGVVTFLLGGAFSFFVGIKNEDHQIDTN